MRSLTKEEVEKALANDAWDFGNQVLYDLCSQHPFHKSQQEIIAKVWMIGRTYAAALERRKNKSEDSDGDLFYEDKAFPKIKNSGIDDWIGSLKTNSRPEEAIEAHSKVTNLFYEISELEKRSLASKYLHFHRPSLFFIYDSRAVKAIRQITPASEKQLPSLSPTKQDEEYLKFYRRCLWLSNELEGKLGRKPSPREIDKVLLIVADERI
jgi:tRNA nucleotidyltransferase/poly(A) polymerase